MKEFDQFVEEIKTVCRKYGVVLVGTCMAEGINGEISVYRDDEHAFNFVDETDNP